MKPPKTNKIKRVSKDQWLTKALDTLESSGVEAVKIERLAKGLVFQEAGSTGILKTGETCWITFWIIG
jgi:hypothetical protein